jgi:hypothetical protein
MATLQQLFTKALEENPGPWATGDLEKDYKLKHWRSGTEIVFTMININKISVFLFHINDTFQWISLPHSNTICSPALLKGWESYTDRKDSISNLFVL